MAHGTPVEGFQYVRCKVGVAHTGQQDVREDEGSSGKMWYKVVLIEEGKEVYRISCNDYKGKAERWPMI